MAKPRPGKKAKAKPVQPQLPGMPAPLPPGTTRVLPMELQFGDRLTDETGEWEAIGRPDTTAGGNGRWDDRACPRSAGRTAERRADQVLGRTSASA
jgi:hypothetical protein